MRRADCCSEFKFCSEKKTRTEEESCTPAERGGNEVCVCVRLCSKVRGVERVMEATITAEIYPRAHT